MNDLAVKHQGEDLASRPTLVASPAEQRELRRRYHRAYTLTGAGAPCLVQRVRVHIKYHSGPELCADYRQTYYEFFQFDRPDAQLVDTHDFDLMRDGWRQSVIQGLLKQHRAPTQPKPSGEPLLTVHKQFVLAAGEVHDARPREIRDGAHFGLLAIGPSGPSRTTLRIARGDGSWHTIHSLPPCPAGYPVAGTGTMTSKQGWRAFERYRFAFATLAGAFVDRGSYLPHAQPLATTS